MNKPIPSQKCFRELLDSNTTHRSPLPFVFTHSWMLIPQVLFSMLRSWSFEVTTSHPIFANCFSSSLLPFFASDIFAVNSNACSLCACDLSVICAPCPVLSPLSPPVFSVWTRRFCFVSPHDNFSDPGKHVRQEIESLSSFSLLLLLLLLVRLTPTQTLYNTLHPYHQATDPPVTRCAHFTQHHFCTRHRFSL